MDISLLNDYEGSPLSYARLPCFTYVHDADRYRFVRVIAIRCEVYVEWLA